MNTFFYNNLKMEIPEGVYYPREDSILFADFLNEINVGGKKVLEIGCGSGFLSIICAKKGAKVTSVDIDENSVKTTLKNAELNKVSLNSFCSDVFKNVKGKFDIIIFNSPYLPKDNYEKDIKESIQWSNEKALKLFLSDFKNYLNKKGFALLLISSITNIDEIELNKFKYNIVSRKKIDWEELKILKLEP